MKAIISINKPHTDNIFDRIKTVEWRTKPLPLCKHFVYETKNKGGCGMVIGEMEITKNISFCVFHLDILPEAKEFIKRGCIPLEYLIEYAKNKAFLYANVIENAKRYDKPKKLSEFHHFCTYPNNTCEDCAIQKLKPHCHYGEGLTRPPQSWQYIEENKDE